MTHIKHFAVLGLLLALCGCDSTAQALGLGRNPPDEFAVVDRPPLSMPPDYDLRPPRPGAPRPQEVKTQDRASQTLFTSPSGAKSFVSGSGAMTEKSDSEKALLDAAGSAKAEADIREKIDRETQQKIAGSKQLVDDLLWWRDPNGAATTVDAKAEAERIKEAKDKGASITNGATPVIEKSKTGWLGL